MIATLLIADVLLVLASGPRLASSPDGSALLSACSAAVRQADGASLSVQEAGRAMWCVGYVGGFIDGLAVLNWRGGSTKVCLPAAGLEIDQAIRVLVQYLRANPERLHESGRPSVLVSIGEAFACK